MILAKEAIDKGQSKRRTIDDEEVRMHRLWICL